MMASLPRARTQSETPPLLLMEIRAQQEHKALEARQASHS